MFDWIGTAVGYILVGSIILVVVGYVFSMVSELFLDIASFLGNVKQFFVGSEVLHEQQDYPSQDLPTTINMTYQDNSGVITERSVTIYNIENDYGEIYFKGRCHLRNSPRTFKVSNIIGDIVNTKTGEIDDFENIFHQVII